MNRLPSVTQMLTSGMTAEQIAMALLEGLNPNLLDEAKVAYRCDCSRERTKGVLASLGKQDLEDIASKQEEIQVCCHFCNKVYSFTPQEVRELEK